MVQNSSSPLALRLIVAAALVDEERRILVQKRPQGKPLAGLWEFPGGKIEAGESPEDALVRELQEELDIKVSPSALVPFTFASERLGDSHLLLMLYLVEQWEGVPQPLAADRLRWCTIEELATLEMPPADVPLVARLSAGF